MGTRKADRQSLFSTARENASLISAVATLLTSILILISVLIAMGQLKQATAQSEALNKSIKESNQQAQLNRQMTALTIQQQLRERYLEINRAITDIGALDYPENDRHYGPVDRRLVRRYWEEQVRNEYTITNTFQGGVMLDEWDNYKRLIKEGLDYKILKEEWCIVRERFMSDTGRDDAIAKHLVKEVDALRGNIDCAALKKERDKDIQLAIQASGF